MHASFEYAIEFEVFNKCINTTLDSRLVLDYGPVLGLTWSSVVYFLLRIMAKAGAEILLIPCKCIKLHS